MGTGVSHDGLHVWLWKNRLRNGTVRVVQAEVCERLAVNRYTLNRVLARMVDEGRLRSLTDVKGGQSVTYVVVDPREWLAALTK